MESSLRKRHPPQTRRRQEGEGGSLGVSRRPISEKVSEPEATFGGSASRLANAAPRSGTGGPALTDAVQDGTPWTSRSTSSNLAPSTIPRYARLVWAEGANDSARTSMTDETVKRLEDRIAHSEERGTLRLAEAMAKLDARFSQMDARFSQAEVHLSGITSDIKEVKAEAREDRRSVRSLIIGTGVAVAAAVIGVIIALDQVKLSERANTLSALQTLQALRGADQSSSQGSNSAPPVSAPASPPPASPRPAAPPQ